MLALSSAVASSGFGHECDNLVPREVVHAQHHKLTCRQTLHALNNVARSVNILTARLSSPISGDLSTTRVRDLDVNPLRTLHFSFIFDAWSSPAVIGGEMKSPPEL